MVNIKEAAEQLTSAGISANEWEVTQWIEKGKIEAKKNPRRQSSYRISASDLADFIVRTKVSSLSAQLIEAQRQNEKLTEQMDILHTRLNIEQSKVRTLKKLLNRQIESAHSHAPHLADLLGLGTGAQGHIVKKEFRKLLKALHPDRGGDERLFKVFKNYYERLE